MIQITPSTHHNLQSCAAELNLTLEGLARTSTCARSVLLLNNCVVEVQTLVRFLELIPRDKWQRDQVERSERRQLEVEEVSDQERSPGIRSTELRSPELGSPKKHDSQTRSPEKHNSDARSPKKYDSERQIPGKGDCAIQNTEVQKLLEQSLEDHELLERSLDEMDKRVERLIEELSPEKSPRKEWGLMFRSPNKPKKINAVEKAFLDATIDSALRGRRDRKGNSSSVGSLLEFPQPMMNSTMMNSTMMNSTMMSSTMMSESEGVSCEMSPVEQRIDAVNAGLGALMKDIDQQRSAVSHRRSSLDTRLRGLREGLNESMEGDYVSTSRDVDEATRGAVLRALGKRNARKNERNFNYLSMEDAIRNINTSLDGMLNESFDRSHMS